MKKAAIITISSSYVVITTLIYALAATMFFEVDETSGKENSNVNDAAHNDNKLSVPKLVDTSCKSPCPPSAEMCIQMCA